MPLRKHCTHSYAHVDLTFSTSAESSTSRGFSARKAFAGKQEARPAPPLPDGLRGERSGRGQSGGWCVFRVFPPITAGKLQLSSKWEKKRKTKAAIKLSKAPMVL